MKVPRTYAVEVEWDTDDQVHSDLPQFVNVPTTIDMNHVAEYLTDRFGWLVSAVVKVTLQICTKCRLEYASSEIDQNGECYLCAYGL